MKYSPYTAAGTMTAAKQGISAAGSCFVVLRRTLAVQ